MNYSFIPIFKLFSLLAMELIQNLVTIGLWRIVGVNIGARMDTFEWPETKRINAELQLRRSPCFNWI